MGNEAQCEEAMRDLVYAKVYVLSPARTS